MSGMPPASPALADFYRRHAASPVAFIDESYSVDPRFDTRFYVMSAVIVQPTERDALRTSLRALTATSFWHTTDQLRTAEGRARVREVLACLADPQGSEICVLSHVAAVETGDTNGEDARARAFRALLTWCSDDACPAGATTAFVMERRRLREEANTDAATKARALREGLIPSRTGLIQVSPSDENLLWFADAVCSAYRQDLTGRDPTLYGIIAGISTIVSP
ncbi:DUF3800 domain-containing protein [Demequina sp. NBRC 110051]|uniref:DUF3800 domain-containing protein n=1 Tax=Demequina sp. NBRC 110051 TaxID=1570340 RepID=UPI00117C6B9E|nr:DUF3800 domain-containing protein [Demequina sp. NBRC 110051]